LEVPRVRAILLTRSNFWSATADSGLALRDRQDAKTPRREPDEEVDRLAHAVIDAAIEVHLVLGPGFGENVYERALCIELELRDIPFSRQPMTNVSYKGEGRPDLLVANRVVVELKVVPALAPVHTAQVLAYLKATGRQLGLLINFDVARLASGVKRVVLGRVA
jgi:GxxExxY protein